MKTRPLYELRAYRERQKPPLSRSALAERIGVSRATVSRWESGDRFPDKQYIPEISQLTGVPILELMGMSE